jgi:uncharacterized protein with HEPN domain
MSPQDRDLGYVWDMHDAACQILEFSKDRSFEDYHQNKMLRLAIERLLEIMGQAAKEVSLVFRQQYSDLPWIKIIGLRNILAHEYGEVKDEKIYLVTIKDIPPLIKQLKSILEKNKALD